MATPGDKEQGSQMPAIETTDHQTVIPDFEIDALAHCLLPTIRAYYESPEGKKAFEEWLRQRNT